MKVNNENDNVVMKDLFPFEETEGNEFTVHEFVCEKDLSKYIDSMFFNSGNNIATMSASKKGRTVDLALDIRGEVNVDFKGDTYTCPSEFPEELINIMKNDMANWAYSDPDNIYVSMNNWFEYIYDYFDEDAVKANSKVSCWSDGIVFEDDLSIYTPEKLMLAMAEVCLEILNENIDNEEAYYYERYLSEDIFEEEA